MKSRKCCVSCGKPLLVFQGHFLHPESPCSGIVDTINIEATIGDTFVQEKFNELYGKPEIDDYDLLNKLLKNKIIKFVSKFIK